MVAGGHGVYEYVEGEGKDDVGLGEEGLDDPDEEEEEEDVADVGEAQDVRMPSVGRWGRGDEGIWRVSFGMRGAADEQDGDIGRWIEIAFERQRAGMALPEEDA